VMIIQFNPVQFLCSNSLSQQPNGQPITEIAQLSNSLSQQPNGQPITETAQLRHKLQRTIIRTMKQTQTNEKML